MSKHIPMTAGTRARILDRRNVLIGGTLSGAAVALLVGSRRLLADGAPQQATLAQDITILNSALGAEHEAVAAYQLGAESGLLKSDVLKLAVQFQDHHKAHVDVLASTIGKLGGEAAMPRKEYAFPVDSLKTQNDVLTFAAGLEQGAVSAYLGAVPLFEERELARAAASILGDEAMHWAVLRYVLGENPVPVAFVS